MRKYFLLSLLLAGFFAGTAVYALPPPSSLSAREKRAVATPTPIAKSRVVVPEGRRPSTVVVIDPGHGGFDRGGIPHQRVPESMMNLDVAQRLKAVLQASGYHVVMTRDSDVFIPLGTRVAIANSYRDAIFVCIHFNATPRSSASGIETYFYSSQSLPLASAIHYYVAGGAPSACGPSSPRFRPGRWDLVFEEDLVVELDEELHFNRYRASTLTTSGRARAL